MTDREAIELVKDAAIYADARWIPCRERSPEVGIRYLLLIKNDYERRKKMNDTEWHGGYYSPNPDYKEDESIYHSYHTYDSFRYRMEHIMEFDDDGKVVREDNG